jgi:tetratricopeptide (TPR) repeat protein
MALIYNQRGETDKALDAVREARAQNPDDLNLILTEANVHYAMGNIKKFKELLEYATERDPNNYELQYNLGVIAAEAKDIENAKKYYERAIALKPDYVNAYINLAVVILDPEVKIINEMNSLIDCNRASCFDRYDNLKIQKRKLYIEAIPLIEKALEFNPNSLPLLKKMAEMLPAVERYDDEKKYKELIKSLEQ